MGHSNSIASYISRINEHKFTQKLVHKFSEQHNSQKVDRKNPNVNHLMSGSTNFGISVYWNIS